MQLIPYYLERAATVRTLANTMTGSDVRRTLLMLAEQWEALAAQVTRVRETQASCDSGPPSVDGPDQSRSGAPTEGS